MAGPQIEDGYTKIANELLEAIINVNLSNYEFRVFMAIIRKTYGFNKKTDRISLSQLSDITGIKIPHICRALNKLLERNMILKNGKTKGINKDYHEWKLPIQAVPKQVKLPKQAVPNEVMKVTYTGNKKLPEQADTKEKKETIKRNSTSCQDSESPDEKPIKYLENSIPFLLANNLYKNILKNNPKQKYPNFQEWAKHIDLMIRIDKRTEVEIREIIEWCQKDSFWYANILSTAKLREKYDQLYIKMKGNKNGGQTGKHFANERTYTDEEQKRIDKKFYRE